MTTHRRRKFWFAALTASSLLAGPACADSYPSGPVRVVVGFPAGGTTDVVARIIGDWLQTRLGQAPVQTWQQMPLYGRRRMATPF